MPARVPAGVQVRDAALPDDAGTVTDLARAVEDAHAGRREQSASQAVADLADALAHGGGGVVAGEPDGTALAAAWVRVLDPADEQDRPARLVLDVRAGPDGARCVGPLVAWGLQRAARWLAAHDRADGRLEASAHRTDTALVGALAGVGFEPSRTFWRMERTLDAGDADPPAPPPGVVVRRVTGDDGRRLVHLLWLGSFADHPGFRWLSYEEWSQRLSRWEGEDPDQWWVADLDGRPVGHCIGDRRLDGTGGGYVRSVGVLPHARGRGIGAHLLRTAFADHVRRGWTFTQLFVDSANPTGALRLYRAVGMAPAEVVDELAARIVADPTTRVPS